MFELDNKLEFNGKFISMANLEDLLTFVRSDDFESLKKLYVNKVIKSKKTVEKIDYIKLFKQIGIHNIDVVRLDDSFISFWKHINSLLIKSITQDVGNVLLKTNQFSTFNDIVDFQNSMDTWDKFIVNKGLPNFSQQQSNNAKVLSEEMEKTSNSIVKYLKLLKDN